MFVYRDGKAWASDGQKLHVVPGIPIFDFWDVPDNPPTQFCVRPPTQEESDKFCALTDSSEIHSKLRSLTPQQRAAMPVYPWDHEGQRLFPCRETQPTPDELEELKGQVLEYLLASES